MTDRPGGEPENYAAPVVTIAALAGAAGSAIGARVADRLGVPFLDREIPQAVAGRAGLPERAVLDFDAQPSDRGGRVARRLGRLSTMTGGAGGSVERLDLEDRQLLAHVEEFLARAAVGGGVAMGRGGVVVLRPVPHALHVHLGGPFRMRVAHHQAQEGLDHATAAVRCRAEDRTRIDYVRRNYRVDGNEPQWYHMMLDSTALAVDVCAELIVTAALARVREPRPSPAMRGRDDQGGRT